MLHACKTFPAVRNDRKIRPRNNKYTSICTSRYATEVTKNTIGDTIISVRFSAVLENIIMTYSDSHRICY